LKDDFFDITCMIEKLLRLHHVSYQGISDIMALIYFVKGAPATNNGVENYYSTSLKTHRKKQLRTDNGIENQMKLSAMKRAGLLGKCKKTLLEAFLMFVPFLDHG
jgi:hypothetical protein